MHLQPNGSLQGVQNTKEVTVSVKCKVSKFKHDSWQLTHALPLAVLVAGHMLSFLFT